MAIRDSERAKQGRVFFLSFSFRRKAMGGGPPPLPDREKRNKGRRRPGARAFFFFFFFFNRLFSATDSRAVLNVESDFSLALTSETSLVYLQGEESDKKKNKRGQNRGRNRSRFGLTNFALLLFPLSFASSQIKRRRRKKNEKKRTSLPRGALSLSLSPSSARTREARELLRTRGKEQEATQERKGASFFELIKSSNASCLLACLLFFSSEKVR